VSEDFDLAQMKAEVKAAAGIEPKPEKPEASAPVADTKPDPEVEVSNEEVEYTEIELEAMEHGWRPEGVEGKRALTAEEFLDRQPFYDEIRALKKDNKKLRTSVDKLVSHQRTIAERERAAALEELKQKKAYLLENEDYEGVVEVDEQIAETKAQADAPDVNPNQEVFEEWSEKNDWYEANEEMKRYADMIGHGYGAANPGTPLEKILNYVENEVKARFPNEFGNRRREAPPPVEGASRGRSRSAKARYSARDLPEADRDIMRTIVRTGVMSEEDYLKEYFGQ
jgi:hypothetical protein